MGERKGTKALELWCKKMTEGYPGVKVENMTTSWRDGLAFCAIIHHFRPELIDFSKLNKDNIFYNNELAFTVAEKYLGIPALLEPEDMVEYDVPDRLSILTYLSQFYRTFMTSQGTSPVRTVPKRPASVTSREGVVGGGLGSPTSTSPPSKMAIRSGSTSMPRREPCAKCGNPVYIAERLNVGKLLYHRTCFRCARCNSQLTLANYYETETHQFCCETCPDEESTTATTTAMAIRINDSSNKGTSVLSRSLSDEEKSESLKTLSYEDYSQRKQDLYSTTFETALENTTDTSSLERSKYSQARSDFLTTHLVNAFDSSTDKYSTAEIPPELPKTEPPLDIVSNNTIFSNKNSEHDLGIAAETSHLINTGSNSKIINDNNCESESPTTNLFTLSTRNISKTNSGSENLINENSALKTDCKKLKKADDDEEQHHRHKSVVNSRNNDTYSVTDLKTENSKTENQVTKEDTKAIKNVLENVDREYESGPSSLVKSRMKWFETSSIKDQKSQDQENLNRSLITDVNIIKSPEKKIASTHHLNNDSVKAKHASATVTTSPSSVSPNRHTLVATNNDNTNTKDVNKNITSSSPKPLNFLLQKQIALKEGKISPMKLIHETRKLENNETKVQENALKREVELRNSTFGNSLLINNFQKTKDSSDMKDDNQATKKSSLHKDKANNDTKTHPSNLLSKKATINEKKKDDVPASFVATKMVKVSSRKKPPDASLGKSAHNKKKVLLQTSFVGSSNRSHILIDDKNMSGNRSNFCDIPLSVAKTEQLLQSIPNNQQSYPDGKANVLRLQYENKNICSSDTVLNKTDLMNKDEYKYSSMWEFSSMKLNETVKRQNLSNTSSIISTFQRRSNSIDSLNSKNPMRNLYRSKSEECITIECENKNVNVDSSNSNDKLLLTDCDKLERPHVQDKITNVGYNARDDVIISNNSNKIESVNQENKQTQNQNNVSEVLQTAISGQTNGKILCDEHLITMEDADGQTGKDGNGRDTLEKCNSTSDEMSVAPTTVTSFENKEIAKNEVQSVVTNYPENLNPFEDDNHNDIEDKHKKNLTSPNINRDSSILRGELKQSMNPFEDDTDEENEANISENKLMDAERNLKVEENHKPVPAIRKKIVALQDSVEIKISNTNPFEDDDEDNNNTENLHDNIKSIDTAHIKRISMNPFEEDSNEEHDYEEEKNITNYNSCNSDISSSVCRKLTIIPAPKISLSPCWSDIDGEDAEDDDENIYLYDNHRPIPTPRKFRYNSREESTAIVALSPELKSKKTNHEGRLSFGSNSSLSSGQLSGHHSARKKKPAPRPPILSTVEQQKIEYASDSQTSSPSTSISMSPRSTPKNRKTKKAPPLPPSYTSTPVLSKNSNIQPSQSILECSSNSELIMTQVDDIDQDNNVNVENCTSVNKKTWKSEKMTKDMVNENRRTQSSFMKSSLSDNEQQEPQQKHYTPNKSTYGKWKRKKGPAPSRPVPQRRTLKALPITEFRQELDLIELQKQGLEKQGVRLEQIIRNRCEGPESVDEDCCKPMAPIPIDVEDLILQLFEVVNEKNELSRREAELMYLQRQQRLEEEHADIEYQIRCLMMQPEVNKTDSDKAKEEELIQRLVEIVERRNEIVECLEMDRLREAEEDDSISSSLNNYASRRDEYITNTSTMTTTATTAKEEIISKKERKKTKKTKKSKNKNCEDLDKDIDENEINVTPQLTKEKKKKKFALF